MYVVSFQFQLSNCQEMFYLQLWIKRPVIVQASRQLEDVLTKKPHVSHRLHFDYTQ